MKAAVTPEVLDAVREYMRAEGFDDTEVAEAATLLRKEWTEDRRPIAHGDPVQIVTGDYAGKVGHAVDVLHGGEHVIGVRMFGSEQVWLLPEESFKHLDLS